MKNTSVKFKSNENTGIPRELLFLLKQISCIGLGVALSQCDLFTSCAPFGVSLVAALPSGFIAGGAGGAILGYFLRGLSPIRYICAIFIVAIIRYSLSNYRRLSEKTFFSPLAATLCCAVTSLISEITSNAQAEEIALCLSEALFAGAGAYFIDNTFKIKLDHGIKNLNSRELSCTVVFTCLVLIGTSVLNIYGMVPTRVLMLVAVLFCAKIGREAWGSIAGILSGLVAIISGEGSYLAGAYAAGGLIAGIFTDFGQIPSAVAFALSCSVVAVSLNRTQTSFTYVYEIAIAAVLFAVMPKSLSEKAEGFLRPAHDKAVYTEQSRAVSEMLLNSSRAVYDAASSVDELSSRLAAAAPNSIQDINERMYEEICRKCGLHNFCWEQNYAESTEIVNALCSAISDFGRLTEENAPLQFVKRCIKAENYLKTFTAYYNDFSQGECAKTRAEHIRERIYDEFGLAASILGDLSNDYAGEETIDKKFEPRVLSVMNSYSLFPQKVTCRVSKMGRLTVEVTAAEIRGRLDKFPITKTLSEACRRSFELPKLKNHNGKTVITFGEKPALRVVTGMYQISGDDSCISGDCGCVYELFDIKKVLMISDGMGSGGNAAVDAAMTTNIISKLTEAGIGFRCALEITNAALMSGGEEEALTTVDIGVIDTFSGNVEFLKAGAARSFVRHNYRSVPIEAVSLPIGILGEVQFARTQAQVGANDIIVMMSDGAASGDTQWVLDELNDYEGNDPNELAQKLATTAFDKNNQKYKDDITVIVGFVRANS